MSEEYNLAKSKKALGPLYPILKAKDGSIIDGFHRQNDDPDWESLTREQIDTPVKVELARLAANFCRRQMPASEFENRVAFLVKNGLKVSEIAEQTGIKESTIYRHMPKELKPLGEAISEGRQVARATSIGILQTPLENCDGCKTPRREVHPWHGRLNLCPDCTVKADLNPESFEHQASIKNGQAKLLSRVPEVKPQTPMQMTKFSDRELMMKVQHSQEETDLLTELNALEITPQTDQAIPLCIPDGMYPDRNVCYFVHGTVHNKGKALNRDEEIKTLLEQRGWTVLVFRHGEGVPKEWASQVQESLRF